MKKLCFTQYYKRMLISFNYKLKEDELKLPALAFCKQAMQYLIVKI